MLKKKLQVFISSTFEDLKAERQEAVQAILKNDHIPAGMELFKAGNKSQLEVVKKWIEESDIYMLILGGRYGSIEPESGLSYTEVEYDYAIKQGIPVFTLILTEDFLYRKKSINTQLEVFEKENEDKYQAFKDKVMSKVRGEINNIDQIASETGNSIRDMERDPSFKFRGWVRPENTKEEYPVSNQPDLNIKGIEKGDLIGNPISIQRNLKDSQFIENLSLEVEKLFNLIKNNKLQLPKIIVQDIKDDNETKIKSRISDININVKEMQALLGKEEIKISDVDKKLINKYAAINDLTLEEAPFFNVGNLNKTKNMLGGALYGTGPSYQLNGTDEEKKKYRLICKLINKIKQLNQWIAYFEKIDSQYMVQLAIANNGTTYDEDVDVRLFIKRGNLVKKDKHPLPEKSIIKTATELLDKFYRISGTHEIEEYRETESYIYRSVPKIPASLNSMGMVFKDTYEDLKESFRDEIDNVFSYEYFQNEEFDILSFNITYIKQNTCIAFPAALVFNSEIEEIRIEINSKHSSEVIKERLEINKKGS